MKILNATEMKNITSGGTGWVTCPAFLTDCTGEYKNKKYDWKNGYCTFSYWTDIDFAIKYHSRYNVSLKCFEYDTQLMLDDDERFY